MNKIKKTGLLAILSAFSILAIGIIGEATFIKNDQNKYSNLDEESDNINQPQLFDAELTFYLYEGEGCGCDPISGAIISAFGGEGNESGISDDDGKCILTLIINSEYRIYIEAEKFQRIIFDIEIIGDQTFKFHMKEEKINILKSTSLLYQFITRLFNSLLI